MFRPGIAVLHAQTLAGMARWAIKAALPAKPVKIVNTGDVIRNPRHKLGVVVRVINSGIGRCLQFESVC